MDTKSLVYIALFAALTAALALFPPIPMPVTGVPITAQSMGPMLAGAIIGARRGFLSQLLFLLLVAVGLPLLSGGRGGFGVFAGFTGGFLISWPIAAFFIGWAMARFGESLVAQIVAIAIGGIGIVYVIGTPWMATVLGMPMGKAIATMAVFVPGDLVKVVLAALIARGVRRALPDM